MPHYYSEIQTSKLIIYKIKSFLRGREVEVFSASGIFSSKKVDRATRLLINNAVMQNGWSVLDLGCGNGIIGIVIAILFPECTVTMSDVNKRALKIAKMNSDKYHLQNCNIINSNLYEKIDQTFDTILTNPPIVAGRAVCYEIIEKAKDHLKKKGLLQLVARHQKGGKQLEKKMKEVFGNVKCVVKKGGFRVYVSEIKILVKNFKGLV